MTRATPRSRPRAVGLAGEQLRPVLEYARELHGARGASFFCVDEDEGDLVLQATTHGPAPSRPTSFRRGEGLVGRAAATGRPYFTPALSEDPHLRVPPNPPPEAGSLLAVPIRAPAGIQGVLNLTWQERCEPPRRAEVEHLEGTVSGFLRSRGPQLEERQSADVQLQSAARAMGGGLPAADALPGLELACFDLPLHDLGGDLIYARPRPAGGLAVIADVAGHDLGAALGAAMLRALLRRDGGGELALGPLLATLDEVLGHELPPGWFATLLALDWDQGTGTLSLGRAGHPPALLDLPEAPEVVELGAGTCALGLGLSEPEVETLAFPPGATLLAYTDGLEAAFGGSTRCASTLAARLRGARHRPPGELRDRLVRELLEAGARRDDAALLLLRRPA